MCGLWVSVVPCTCQTTGNIAHGKLLISPLQLISHSTKQVRSNEEAVGTPILVVASSFSSETTFVRPLLAFDSQTPMKDLPKDKGTVVFLVSTNIGCKGLGTLFKHVAIRRHHFSNLGQDV